MWKNKQRSLRYGFVRKVVKFASKSFRNSLLLRISFPFTFALIYIFIFTFLMYNSYYAHSLIGPEEPENTGCTESSFLISM